jgi:hypothetical protein
MSNAVIAKDMSPITVLAKKFMNQNVVKTREQVKYQSLKKRKSLQILKKSMNIVKVRFLNTYRLHSPKENLQKNNN